MVQNTWENGLDSLTGFLKVLPPTGQIDIQKSGPLSMQKRFTPLCDHNGFGPLPPLRQAPDENLESCYRRAEDWLHTLRGLDRGGGDLNQLTEKQYSEVYLLTEEYINGLYDQRLRQRVRINGCVPDNKYSRSLLAVHVTAEAQALVLKSGAWLAKNGRYQSALKDKIRDGSELQEASYAPPRIQATYLAIKPFANSLSHILGTVQAHGIGARLEAESRRLKGLCRWFYSSSSVGSQGPVNMD
ncbi:MAG: hypothetical protein ASARMPREDX12_002055 [Alectoria sarmentosa]|nr:MAG: hypothetical protein ASARMPREDX12_002055 [Alectoria sarmentosa]